MTFLRQINDKLLSWNIRPTRIQALRFGISLLLAILLWGWVTQLQDPYTSRTIANVPIGVETLPESLQLVTSLPDVTVTIKGAESRVRPVEPSDLTITLDTSDIEGPGTYIVRLRAEDVGVNEQSVSPREITIQVDERVAEIFPLDLSSPVSDNQSRVVTSVNADVSQVTVRGPKSAVDRVAKVTLPVTVDQQTETFTASYAPEAIDAGGQRVTEVEVLPAAIQAEVNVQVRGREVSVIAVVTGVPSNGFSVQQRRALPDTIIVDGPDQVLDDLLFVNTDPVDVSNATQSFSSQVNLADLPPGVMVVDPPSGQVEVRVAIESTTSSSQTLSDLPLSTIGLAEGLSVSLDTPSMAIQVSAPVDVLQVMTSNDVVALIDLDGFGPGTYRLTPIITLPQGVTWLSSEPESIVVTISVSGVGFPVASPSSSPVP